ncbi:ABC transporter G family member 1-like [Coffea arabica]|uniref:ABC transporter G family member 1-like n=1 Tax=Coffea arabica TaxID=13443 RepID=A0ABM4WMB5_COFAR
MAYPICKDSRAHLPDLEQCEKDALDVETVDFVAGGAQYGFHGRGVYLTWKDVWVTVSNVKEGTKSFLQGLNGYATPGQLLAIMGPSGCGKSTLLDAANQLFWMHCLKLSTLSGRLGTKMKRCGEILINGRQQELAYGTSAYVTDNDILTWTLTVREAVYYSANLQLPNAMSRSEKKERAERTIREMGLLPCFDTRIGGWGIKGLSNGQKRRVSICMEILTRPKLLFLDEPTSGLDSAAAYCIVNRIVRLARHYGMTVVASLHQPSSEAFKLLDNLCLLCLGRTIYFGPAYAANQFFAGNGFPCPALQNPADHYLRMVNSDFSEDIQYGAGGKTTTREVIDMLAESYRSSDAYKDILRQAAEMDKQSTGTMEKKGSPASFFIHCLVLIERSFLNMYRDVGYYWLRLGINIALGFGLGTVFHNVGNSYSSINARGSMLMFVASLLTIMAIGGFPSVVEDIKGSDRFLYFIMVLIACLMLVETLVMIVATIVPNFLMGLITGAGLQGLMMLSGGFFRLPSDLPKIFWKYPMYYIAFHKYAYQGLYKNEFQGLAFPKNLLAGGSSNLVDGETILRDIWQVEMGYSKWIDLEILFGMVILYRLLLFGAIKIAEKF